MSSGDVQLSAFPDIVPDVSLASAPNVAPADVVPASSEWILVSAKGGPTGWHLVKGIGDFSTVVTLCGLRGAKLSSPSPLIVRCPSCLGTAVRV